jgi:hypothetical protein
LTICGETIVKRRSEVEADQMSDGGIVWCRKRREDVGRIVVVSEDREGQWVVRGER